MTITTGTAPLRPSISARLADKFRSLAADVRLFSRLFRLAWGAAPEILLILMLLQLSLAVTPVVQVSIYKLLVDGIARVRTPAFDLRAIWLAAGVYAITLFLAQAASLLRGPLDEQLEDRLQGAMRLALLGVGQRQAGLAFYEEAGVHDDIENTRRGLRRHLLLTMWMLPETVQKLTIVVTLSALLVRLHPVLPVMLIASALPRLLHEARLAKYVWNGLLNQGPLSRWMQYCARVLFSTEFVKEVRLFGLGDFFLDRYRETFERAHAESVRIRRREERGTTLYALLNAVITGAAYGLTVLAAASGRLSIGDVALFTGATFQLSGALARLTGDLGTLSQDRMALQTFFHLLERPPALAPVGMTAPETRDGRAETGRVSPADDLAAAPPARRAPAIELRDVSFAYPNSSSTALRGIFLRIAPGEKLAIVGENGAGKTSLLNLIARLYDPTAGEILTDGTPLRSLDVRAWRRRLVNVSQEFLRLEAPLRTNLALTALDRLEEDEALRTACGQVGLAEVVGALPEGLDQMLGKRFRGGVELSGGEWQKIALGRALLREEAGVLILDEPTSALDAPTEHAIFRQFVQWAEDRTTILVSHRFSTVTMADRIIVLEAGAIVEEGTHAELVTRGGKYAELFELQAARYR